MAQFQKSLFTKSLNDPNFYMEALNFNDSCLRHIYVGSLGDESSLKVLFG